MTFYVDAIEYAGEDVPPVRGGARKAIRHHAFDMDTGQMAHGAMQVRVGFPDPQRSWTSVPDVSTVCSECRTSVLRTVGERVDRQLRLVLVFIPNHPLRVNEEKQ